MRLIITLFKFSIREGKVFSLSGQHWNNLTILKCPKLATAKYSLRYIFIYNIQNSSASLSVSL